MTRVPIMGFNPLPNPVFAKEMPGAYIGMGDTAENVAAQWGLDRPSQEAFAVASHQKAAKAQAAGKLADEIIAIHGPKGAVIDQDGCIRPETTAETLAELKPAFQASGVVTAGTSSPLTDGASAVLVCSADYAEKHGLPVLAAIKSIAISGCAPEIMGIGPVGSSRKALERAGLTAADLDVIELNEAFASQSLACIKDLGLDPAKINLDGGAIALGHPLGATGARIVGKAAALLKREGGTYALATQCIGGGQGIATVLEAV
jgi:acetyl-CoA acyltransferase